MGLIYSPRTITDLGPGDHLCFLYETEEEHRALLTPFLRQGLERDEKVLYIVDVHTGEDILGYLRSDGLEGESYLASGQLNILTTEDTYLQGGVFDPDRMIAFLRTATERALHEGYMALRVTGEMTWSLRGVPDSEQLIEYESKLNTFFPGSQCLAICQYDRRRFDSGLLLNLLATYPTVVVGTEVYDNLYYIPPADSLGLDHSSATLRRWLENLATLRRAEEGLRQKTVFVQLLQDIAVAANEASTIESAMQFALDRVCTHTGWPVGHAYVRDEDGAGDLIPTVLWHLDTPERFDTFRQVTEETRFASGVGLPGRVLAGGKPVWIMDVAQDPNFTRLELTKDLGIRAAFAFPVWVESEVVAVLEFFSEQAVAPDEPLVEVMAHVGTQLGRVIERTRGEEALRVSNAMFEGLFQAAPDATLLVNTEGRLVRVNSQMAALFGYSQEELLGKPVEILLPTRFRGRHIGHRSVYYADPRTRPMGAGLELYGRRKDGSEFPVDVMLSPLETEAGTLVIGVVRDITERKQVEEAIRRAKDFSERLINSSPNGIFAFDRQCCFTVWNPGMERISGIRKAETLGQCAFDIFPFLSEIGEDRYFHEALAGRTAVARDRPYHVPETDREGFFEAYYSPIRDEAGQVIGGLAILRDITEQKQAEEALHESEARFRAIFEKAAIGISLIDLEGRVIASNPALQEMVGYSEEELCGMPFTRFTHPADVQADMNLFQDLVAGKRNHYRLEKRYLRKDGHVVWGHLTVSMFRDAGGETQFTIGMVKDITERKQMEHELAEVRRRLMESREAERLHLAQELHDGPMQELYGVSYRLMMFEEVSRDETSLSQMVAMQATLQRIIEALRTLSTEMRPPTLAPFGLERAIYSHAETFQETHPELQIQLDVMPDGQALPEQVRLFLFRIYQQALSNVARHAAARHVLIRFTLDAEQVVLEIQDDGCGFKVPTRWIELAREGHLGLVGAAERAEAIGGRLEVVSSPGEGTLIRVVVPHPSEYGLVHPEELLAT